MSDQSDTFSDAFSTLTGYAPMRWQSRLFDRFAAYKLPDAIDLPTGLGKTSVMAIWLIARAVNPSLPRRLVYVVDRRAVVDQATGEAEKLVEALEARAEHFKTMTVDARTDALRIVEELKRRLGLTEKMLPISTLRGQHVGNRDWLADPATPAIIVGTVDMIGSRLLFEGYGVSRKMRPYHAGLFGADTLVVLDEAHLVPPFEALLDAIASGANAFGPIGDEGRKVVPPFRLLSLSATGRARGGERFHLEKGDLEDDIARQRIGAKKRVVVRRLSPDDADAQLARAAFDLGTQGGPRRVIVFCDRRDKKEEAAGPSAAGVCAEIQKLAKAGKIDIEAPVLFVGARRVKERQDGAEQLKCLGFLAGDKPELAKPAFLIATSAGEVGVDLDADHLVCDLVPWERMVQRLGRVNRRGEGDATVVVFHGEEPKANKPDESTEQEKRRIVGFRSLSVIDALASADEGRDASPGALRALKLRAETEEALATKIERATTPEPLRPALTRPLVDAWSMTSLEAHTGRPEIAPWLRGWIEDEQPQTSVVWRKYLPVRAGSEVSRNEVEDFFEAAPPHMSEVLETESWRVAEWLFARAKLAVKPGKSSVLRASHAETESAPVDERDMPQIVSTELPPLKPNDVVAFVLGPDGTLRRMLRLDELATDGEAKRFKEQLVRDLANATLILDARLGGLKGGLLDNDESDSPSTADDGGLWIETNGKPVVGFRVRVSDDGASPDEAEWRESYRFDVERSEDGEGTNWLVIDGLNEERRAESRHPQLLAEHQSWTEARARRIAADVGLNGDFAETLAIAARLHDEGKRARKWQRAFNAKTDGVYAKTKGPLNLAFLDSYRHEFGSLPYAEKDPGFKDLQKRQPELAELVLHLIASHHGGARPVISTRGCEDAPPTALQGRARDVALRFARLQKRWGPWGLAWWEALLRAADQQASRDNDNRDNDKGRGPSVPPTEDL